MDQTSGTWPYQVLFLSFKSSLPSSFPLHCQPPDRPLRRRFLDGGGESGFRTAAGSAALHAGAGLPGTPRARDKLSPADGAAAGFALPWFPGHGLLCGKELDDDLVERADELADP